MQVSGGKESEPAGNKGTPKYASPESVVLVVAPIIMNLVSVMLPVGGGGEELISPVRGSGQDCPAGAIGIVTKLLTMLPISTATGTKQPVIPSGIAKLI